MDYPITLPNQLKQHLRSLRKARGLTQAGLASLLGVVQSRIADIEANPGAVSVEQLLQILSVLNAQVLIRDTHSHVIPTGTLTGLQSKVQIDPVSAAEDAVPMRDKADPPQGQW